MMKKREVSGEQSNQLFLYYIGIEEKLPLNLKECAQSHFQEERLQLYAHVDLNDDLKEKKRWVVLFETGLVVLDSNQKIDILLFKNLGRLKCFKSRGLNIWSFLGKDPEELQLKLIFTHKHLQGMENIRFIIERQLEGKSTHLEKESDDYYQNSYLDILFEGGKKEQVSSKSGVILRLLKYLLPYKNEIALGGFGALCMTLLALVPAYLTGRLIDQILRPYQRGDLSLALAQEKAWVIIFALAGVYVLREFFAWIRLKKMSMMGEKVARDLRRDLYSHIQTLGMDFFSSKQTGSIISRVSSDTDRIWDFVAFGVVEVSISLLMLIALGGVLVSLDWKLGLILTLPVPLLIISIFIHGEKMKKLFLGAWRKWSKLTDILSDTIPGIQVVKAFNKENYEVSRFSERNDDALGEFLGIHRAWTSFWPKLMLSIQFLILLVWFFALPRLLGQEGSESYLSVGVFVSFLLYTTMFAGPIEVIGQMARMLNRATSSAYRIFEVMDTPASIDPNLYGESLTSCQGKIEFQNVSFSYDGMREIIKDLSFTVHPGEMIGLVGPSGGGKSTLMKLLARFYDVGSGKILIDGVDLKTCRLGDYRDQVGMVLQESFLFHGTILDNICYGNPGVDIEKAIEVAKIANAHEFIAKLPQGYETIIGERGHTLSGGERQRVSIARALLREPQILILDEATSAVDTETEAKIQEALDRLVEGRTVFAIAHRLSTLRKANRIFYIEEGQIKEEGTHEELIERGEGYAKLCQMQDSMHRKFLH